MITMTKEQSSTILNELYEQALGESIADIDTIDIVSVGTTLLQTGTTQLIENLSCVLSRTYFSMRPYSAKFKGLQTDVETWGAYSRKLTALDDLVVDNEMYKLTEGESPDQWKFRKQKLVETHFYGSNTWSDYISITEIELRSAFNSFAEWGSFLSQKLQNVADRQAQELEAMSRAALTNFIGAKVSVDDGTVFELLTEYYNETGIYLNTDTVYAEENFGSFAKWAAGFINTISDRMTERSTLFHLNFKDSNNNVIPIPRHTPKAEQHMYVYAPFMNTIKTRVLSDVFNPELMGIGDFEKVNYWQSITDPDEIKVTPAYIGADGLQVAKASVTPIALTDVLGVIFDTDAIRAAMIYQGSATTPINAAGMYYNLWYHYDKRFMNDLTENGCVFLLKQTADEPDTPVTP